MVYLTSQDIATQEDKGRVTLAKCAQRINESHKTAIEGDRLCLEQGQRTIQAVIVAGKNLQVAKAMLPHGHWEKWVEVHCPDISKETAKRYIRLSKGSLVTDLSECETLRQAYLACGVLKEGKKQIRRIKKDTTIYPERLCLRLIKQLESFEDDYGLAERERLLPLLEPIARWYFRNRKIKQSEAEKYFEDFFSS